MSDDLCTWRNDSYIKWVVNSETNLQEFTLVTEICYLGIKYDIEFGSCTLIDYELVSCLSEHVTNFINCNVLSILNDKYSDLYKHKIKWIQSSTYIREQFEQGSPWEVDIAILIKKYLEVWGDQQRLHDPKQNFMKASKVQLRNPEEGILIQMFENE